MKKIALTIATIIFFSSSALAFEDGDFQYWNDEAITWKMTDVWKASLDEMFRFGGNAGTLYYQHSELQATYSGTSEWLDVSAGYRHTFNIAKNKWKYENMPNASATIKLSILNLKLSDRNRIEFRHIQDKDDNWRYRNKFTITFPKLTTLKITPYVADEVFLDCVEGVFNRNRLYAGFSMNVLKGLTLDIYYLWQSSKSKKDWIDYHITGTKLKYSF